MKVAYFDCFSGVSGDMILGSLIDAGLDISLLQTELAKLQVSGWNISAQKVLKNGITGTQFTVNATGDHHHRGLSDILDIIQKSSLKSSVKHSSAEIFRKIARVEATIHGIDIEEVHFHEIGAIDSIIDVAGACAAFDLMGIEAVYASRVNVGEGFVKTSHGLLPVPAPATAGLLAGVPIYSSGVEAELATPTGAAILTHYAKEFGPLPEIKVSSTGYGAGMKDLPVANLLRVHIGELARGAKSDPIVSLETNIDDMNPEFYQHVLDRLLEAGALDVFTTQVIMKKSRPGVLLTVIAREETREDIARIIFEETTTAGIRYAPMERMILDREMKKISTRYGEISVKVLSRVGRVVTVSPEYEECRSIAHSLGIPLKQVYDEAKKIADSLKH